MRSVVPLALALALPAAGERIPIRIERHVPGAPVTLGLPFPKGALRSPDHVRVLTAAGAEIQSQATEVASWQPADASVKWLWLHFVAGEGDRYLAEFGDTVRPAPRRTELQVVNNQRDRGLAEVTTGPLRFTVRQGEGGFLDEVRLDLDGDGFDEDDTIATGRPGRGSFVDLLDDAGVDAASAVVRQTHVERGSGPLHAVLRVEGEYRYGRPDNNPSPFVLRIHAYAGRPFIRVLHTFVYTGVPDKHRPLAGEYAHLATRAGPVKPLDTGDPGWSIPEDRVAGVGLSLWLRLAAPQRYLAGARDGRYWQAGPPRLLEGGVDGALSLFQTGPKPDRQPPLPRSTSRERLAGFQARLAQGARTVASAERADGWLDVRDETRGVAFGIRHFLEEYPKELGFDPATGEAAALAWSPRAGPMSFARAAGAPPAEGALENWAQGLAKTSELVFYFHGPRADAADVARTMGYFLRPPVAHAEPAWYAASGALGRLSPRGHDFPELERALDDKFDWMLFNQRWEPWYGMFDHGDLMVDFDGEAWHNWAHNEPAQDYQLWLQFLRTGDARYFEAAQTLSRHTMDVDNTHWPEDPPYRGDSNHPLDYWKTLGEPPGSPYRGMGRRHSAQHWMHALSAHVWVQGWLADYYLAGEHRGLDAARQTADFHLRRLFGEHELTGRRLYLSVWNLVQAWDATKDPRYGEELKLRVGRLLQAGSRQGGNLVIDRYGYTHVYVVPALLHYLSLTGDPAVRAALVESARFARDNAPLNHFMESYLSSLVSLAAGYELTGERSYVDEIRRRVEPLRQAALPRPIDDSWTQAELAAALEAASRLPPDHGRFRPDEQERRAAAEREARARGESPRPRRPGWSFTNGLRVFGWTSAYSLPYALDALRRSQAERPAGPASGGEP